MITNERNQFLHIKSARDLDGDGDGDGDGDEDEDEDEDDDEDEDENEDEDEDEDKDEDVLEFGIKGCIWHAGNHHPVLKWKKIIQLISEHWN